MGEEWFRKKYSRLELVSIISLSLGILIKNRVGVKRQWEAELRIDLLDSK